MKAIMIMYDSLNRHFLPGYTDNPLDLPNFRRLLSKTAAFDKSYVGSMPCMPARRELQTGRYNFLHRSWGPIEPYDDCVPEILRKNNIHSHLTTDHYHYSEDGGATYHNRYSTYAIYRGQESDRWIGCVEKPAPTQIMSLDKLPDGFRRFRAGSGVQNMCNRTVMQNQEDFPQHKTFADGLDFIERNHENDNWFLQIETFDPHEPFFSPDSFQEKFFDPDKPFPDEDWPSYTRVSESEEQISNMRKKYSALVTMCDEYLGKVLDAMDEYKLWDDTLLIVNTDHGFMLSEHGWWGKSVMPLYEEIAHTPLYIWDPRSRASGERRKSLVQTIDLAPTILGFFGLDIPKSMQGKDLAETVASDKPVREYALYGYFGDSVNITDGRYTYLKAPVAPDAELNEYTLMPTHMNSMFAAKELSELSLSEPFDFTKGCKLMKIPVYNHRQMKGAYDCGDLLFDTENDPWQKVNIDDEKLKSKLNAEMKKLMEETDAPAEQFNRIGL